ncbi:MAG TPA: Dam family site-specific DNA-(adenine-N6)-methyltransferase [Chthonomonadaceae bacterium]|nr:Dam family site-specific DNA-(adenine-N6)-methyltransferase [Chthonomonadaceae bacterium]
MGVPHPIPYQGSKRALAPAILAYLPEDCVTLIEPFAGSAALSLAALYHKRVRSTLLNDINRPLMCLWRDILDRPEAIAEAYQTLWKSQLGREREYYDEIREEFNRTGRTDCFLYLLARCVKAAVRYNAQGEFNQSPDNRRKGAKPSTIREHIFGASRLLRGNACLMEGPYRASIAQATPLDVIYLDPPYQGVCGKRDPRYINEVAVGEFVSFLQELNDKGLSYLVSYDGRNTAKSYGKPLPGSLELTHIEIEAGRSAQATLLGRQVSTIESLYISPHLAARLGKRLTRKVSSSASRQLEMAL